jgi:hypothetical protein
MSSMQHVLFMNIYLTENYEITNFVWAKAEHCIGGPETCKGGGKKLSFSMKLGLFF